MLRSLINSARGKSALLAPTFGLQVPVTAPTICPPIPPARSISTTTRSTATDTTPLRCCVYCGSTLFANPRMHHIICPDCRRQLSIQDIVLRGDVDGTEFITAGRILITSGARIRGDLIACHIEIRGWVLGHVLASQNCRVTATARVAGHLICRSLVMDAGAKVEGEIELIRTQ